MSVPLKYVGAATRYFDTVDGSRAQWTPGRISDVADAAAVALIQTGFFAAVAGAETRYTAAQLSALAAAGGLTPNATYVASDTGRRRIAQSAFRLAPDTEFAQSGNAFTLILGSDHATVDKWGSPDDTQTAMTQNSSGLMQFYLDNGFAPYLAVNTSTDVVHSPSMSQGCGWGRIASLQAAGVEIASHGHTHIQEWDRLNTGIFINYSGAGTGTVQITASQVICTGSGGGDDATLTRSSYPTISSLVAAISAIASGAWTASIPDGSGLSGSEASSNLIPISGSRNVKPAALDGRYFCCGGGLWFSGPVGAPASGANPVETFQLLLRNNGALEVVLNGVRVSTQTLAGMTFATLKSNLNAVADITNAGISFDLADNGWGGTPTFRSYMRGDELATGMASTVTRLVPPGNLIHSGVVEIGLSQRYIRDRQYKLSADVAAANGVTLRGFIESGTSWYPCHQQGHEQWQYYRGVKQGGIGGFPVSASPLRIIGPTMSWARCTPSISEGFSSAAHLEAVADAMADSPGLSSYVLIHQLSPTDGGNGGYNIGVAAGREQNWSYMNAFLQRLKTHMAAGRVVSLRPSEAAAIAASVPAPRNLVFNPKFKGVSSSVSGPQSPASSGYWFPGWRLNLAAGTTMDVDSDGYVTLTSSGATNSFALESQLMLDPDKTYEFGFEVRALNLSAGLGAWATFLRTGFGRVAHNRLEVSAGSVEAAKSPVMLTTGMTWGRYKQRSEAWSRTPLRAIGKQGPYAITGGTNDLFNLRVGAASITLAANLTLTAGASRTAQQVADEINAAIAADANFAASPEQRPRAYAEKKGRTNAALVIECPEEADQLQLCGSTFSCTSLSTLFGGTGGDLYQTFQAGNVITDVSTWPNVLFQIVANLQGSVVLGRPYCKVMELA